SVQLTLGYDPQALEVIAVRPGTLAGQFPYFIERHGAGSISVDMSGPALSGGTGSLIELEVRVNENVSGPITVDLQAAALNEGHLTIGLPPQAGSDPTDGLIAVSPSGQSEPAASGTEVAPTTIFANLKAKLTSAADRIAA